MRHRKVGGIHFLRAGRLQFSFCRCRRTEPAIDDCERVSEAIIVLIFASVFFAT